MTDLGFILEIICDIYEQAGIYMLGFPVADVIYKLGIVLITYSSFKNTPGYDKLIKKHPDGVSTIYHNRPVIIYNDEIESEGRITQTLCHELGHIVLGHYQLRKGLSRAQKEREANLFASMFYVPFVLLWYFNIYDTIDIYHYFGVSYANAEIQSKRFDRCAQGFIPSEQEQHLLDIFLANSKKHEEEQKEGRKQDDLV